MTQHHVIVPAWRRPGFLHACLVRLIAADNGTARYTISIDRDGDTLNSLPIAMFTDAIGEDRVTVDHRIHYYPGNSFNVLCALTEASQNTDTDLVHVVEEDVLVAVDHFAVHERMHSEYPAAFAASSCANQNLEPAQVALLNAPFYSHPSYQSLAVSMRREIAAKVAEHLGIVYFSDPIGYCERVFPDSLIPRQNAEQDGLLNRIREREEMGTVYTAHPRAYHAGFTGYHRAGAELEGTPQEQGEQILAMGADELNAHAPEEFRDHTTCDLDLV